MSHNKSWTWVLLFAAAALAMIGVLALPRMNSTSESSSGMDMSAMDAAQLAAPQVGRPVPVFEFVDVDGHEFPSQSLRGSVVVLNVWASWCAPCKEEMPAFEKLQNKYRDRGLRILGVSIDFTADDARQFAREMGVSYPIIHQPDIMGKWGLLGLPTTIIVDRDGIIRRMIIGFEYADSFEKSILDLM